MAKKIKKSDTEIQLRTTLRSLLQARGLSQREFARLVGVPASTVDSWLAGTTPQDLVAVKRGAKILGVTIAYLLFGEADEAQSMPSFEELFTREKVVHGIYEVSVKKLTLRSGRKVERGDIDE